MSLKSKIVFASITILLLSAVGAPAAKPVMLAGKGTGCVILDYEFDTREEDFPDLAVADNALLLLRAADSRCEPTTLTVEQNQKAFKEEGYESMYVEGAFHVVYFGRGFDKFVPFKLTGECGNEHCEIDIDAETVKALAGNAVKNGKKVYVDPIDDAAIKNVKPLELADLLSYGRIVEYSNEAMNLYEVGGLPRLRREARTSFEKDDPLKAACLATMALKWATINEVEEIRDIAAFQDWVLVARSFRKMKRPLAAAIAYEQALKIRDDAEIAKEKSAAQREIKVAPKADENYRPELSEMEIASKKTGSIPIPAKEANIIQAGVAANGVYLGDHRDKVAAQCGRASETLSELLLYFDHQICPEAVFISRTNRVYSIKTRRGELQPGLGIGASFEKVEKSMGAPDRLDPVSDDVGKAVGKKYVYLKKKISFIDLDGDGSVDMIEVFDFIFAP